MPLDLLTLEFVFPHAQVSEFYAFTLKEFSFLESAFSVQKSSSLQGEKGILLPLTASVSTRMPWLCVAGALLSPKLAQPPAPGQSETTATKEQGTPSHKQDLWPISGTVAERPSGHAGGVWEVPAGTAWGCGSHTLWATRGPLPGADPTTLYPPRASRQAFVIAVSLLSRGRQGWGMPHRGGEPLLPEHLP